MNGFPSRHRITIWIEDLNSFRKSWQTIIVIIPRMIYPSHGKPFPVFDLKRFFPHLNNVKMYHLREM